ncbi:acyltransferase family protein [Pararhodonellum marinum]|uniref:acyltransferase family protein n=1 Tax=Pararhodonellum marinum TaxID=2755358 RepID=UPI00188DEAB4|nr:acyltransferase family protein [Pararhodonellum marinum]
MRRNDLDWLRVIVFSILIFYHVGMFFVPWDYHLKNNILYPNLKWPMLFVNQWRLPILFVISGMGTYYALSKKSGFSFIKERIWRLFLPLLVGMLFIVPPQVYFERLSTLEFTGNYFEFWPSKTFLGSYPEGNLSWHHLWFLPYLLIFSLILVPIFLYLRNHKENLLLKLTERLASSPFGLFCLIFPLFIYNSILAPNYPSTHALVGDWFNLINYITLFFLGFIFISIKETFWKTVMHHRKIYLLCGILGFSFLLLIWLVFERSPLIYYLESLVRAFNTWSWIMTIFGFAASYLNGRNTFLSYANEAVYPFYILHQTVTITLGYYLMNLDWGLLSKFTLMVFGTFGISLLLYEYGIRRWKFIRPLFGLKQNKLTAVSVEEVPKICLSKQS